MSVISCLCNVDVAESCGTACWYAQLSHYIYLLWPVKLHQGNNCITNLLVGLHFSLENDKITGLTYVYMDQFHGLLLHFIGSVQYPLQEKKKNTPPVTDRHLCLYAPQGWQKIRAATHPENIFFLRYNKTSTWASNKRRWTRE